MNPDSWTHLRDFTAARLAPGRAGGSLPTGARLDFQLAHAQARDAVHAPFDAAGLAIELREHHPLVEQVRSRANDRATFLLRPDLGRQLAQEDRERLSATYQAAGCDLVIIISDGLSSHAAHRQAPALLVDLLPMLAETWKLGPLVIATHGRVALQDEIGEALGARWSLMLLGERPGLGSPDSLGAYFTHFPRPGRTDAERNCVSNIRPEGLPTADAAVRLAYLLNASRQRGLSGVALKDDSPGARIG